MQVDDAMRVALATVGLPDAVLSPAIGGVVSPIHRAVENHCCFATEGNSDPVFVKRRHDDMAVFITPEHAAEASGKAGELGIAPRLLHADPANGILVFEALGEEWAWGHTDVLRRPSVLENLLLAKRAFHKAVPLSETRSVFNLIADYRQLADAADVILPAPVLTVTAAAAQIATAITCGHAS